MVQNHLLILYRGFGLVFFKAEILHWSMTPLSFSIFLNSLLVLEFHCVWWLSETIFCFLFFAASLLFSKFCLSILNQSVTCFPSCIYCPGSHGTENCLTLEKRQRHPGRRWALAGEQTSWSYGTWVVQVLATSRLPVYWMSLRAKGPSSKCEGLVCVTVLSADTAWERAGTALQWSGRGRLSVIPHQNCHTQGRLCSSHVSPISCSCCW